MATFQATVSLYANAYEKASTSSKLTRILAKGTLLTITKTSGAWWYAQNVGWVQSAKCKKISTATKQSKTAQKKAAEAAALKKQKEKNESVYGKNNGKAFKQGIINNAKIQAKLDSTVLDNSTRLFGMPHQFMTATDMLFANGVNLGRKYAETFMAEAPIVNFVPGRANYMPGMSMAEKKSVVDAFKYSSTKRDVTDILKKIGANKDVRYFNFHGDYATYMTYVNLLCRTAAIYMGLGEKHPYNYDYKKEKKTYKHFDWSTYRFRKSDQLDTSSSSVGDSIFEKTKKAVQTGAQEILKDIKDALSVKNEGVQFYVDPATSFQETASNSTGVSMVESAVTAVDDMSKEISFMVNSLAGSWVDAGAKTMGNSMNQIMGKFSPNNVFGRLLGTAGTVVLQGNNMIFPEIWKGSDYSKSYNITVKLTTPYGSKESIYLNIIVPLMHLICLALPRQNTANSYTTPFIVKASSKGLFSCNMGIVDNLSVEKVQGSYTIDGLPTEVVVQMSLRDLYADLMITPSNSPVLFFENEGLRDWLVVTCGMDVNKPYIIEKYKAVLNQLLNQAIDIPKTVTNIISDKVKNALKSIW